MGQGLAKGFNGFRMPVHGVECDSPAIQSVGIAAPELDGTFIKGQREFRAPEGKPRPP